MFTDNGPQFAAAEFKQFADSYGFCHKTSSPRYPQSNGEAERAVQTIKHLLKKAEDPYHALLVYRATPLQNGYSPAELLMNRRLRTDLPTVSSQLKPSVPDMVKIQEKEIAARRRREDNFDHIHRAKSLEPLMPGYSVWMTDQREDGVVTEQVAPRSYSVATPVGEFRRNRRHLNLLPVSGDSPPQDSIRREEAPEEPQSNSDIGPRSNLEPLMSSSHSKPEPRPGPYLGKFDWGGGCVPCAATARGSVWEWDVPPPAQSAEAKVYFYFVKYMGAKTPQRKHF